MKYKKVNTRNESWFIMVFFGIALMFLAVYSESYEEIQTILGGISLLLGILIMGVGIGMYHDSGEITYEKIK